MTISDARTAAAAQSPAPTHRARTGLMEALRMGGIVVSMLLMIMFALFGVGAGLLFYIADLGNGNLWAPFCIAIPCFAISAGLGFVMNRLFDYRQQALRKKA